MKSLLEWALDLSRVYDRNLDPLTVHCPACGRDPGRECKNSTSSSRYHRRRVREAQRMADFRALLVAMQGHLDVLNVPMPGPYREAIADVRRITAQAHKTITKGLRAANTPGCPGSQRAWGPTVGLCPVCGRRLAGRSTLVPHHFPKLR